MLIKPPNDRHKKLTEALEHSLESLRALLRASPSAVGALGGGWIGELVQAFDTAIAAADWADAETQTLPLVKLALDLQAVRDWDPEYLREVRRRFKREGPDQFRGTRFEVTCAASFLKKRLKVRRARGKKGKSRPDFYVDTPHGEVQVECTAPHVTKKTGGYYGYKITAAVSGKGRKGFAGPETLLIVDLSGMEYAALRDGGPPPTQVDGFRESVEAEIADQGIGGAVLYLTQVTGRQVRVGYERVYFSILGPSASDGVRWLLERHYPKQGHTSSGPRSIMRQP